MLEIKDFGLAFAQQHFLSKLNMSVAGGEIVTIMGPSGCGKSSFLAAIAGTLDEGFTCSGEVSLAGKSLLNMPQAQRQVGMLFQDDLLFPHFNVAQNLQYGLAHAKQGQAAQLIEQALADAGMPGYQQRDIASLSGGQRARVSVLRSLLAEPKLLLLDEPFSKLDKPLRKQFREFVRDKIEELSIPALLVTHDAEDCLQAPPISIF
ncbi:ATP-binding cassette domain-containing protein [Agarivorans sp. B2Z047]|uniref:ATP-binding cassette domain-containing protein n=1 Tax=Agarivorans sp. B2Z047 TaxID=2652721 RepID=UPI00128D2D62|nr:ATP-binding cassette domain-containing protein [Agarivorans sp. B2Z047]MPW28284.1 ATP-binding cassette domain-containing protein [Agarivorans sp. B2Z047]UQN43890.1 ATP-binding cassette domain-containing protein [Agarivorans sp. B2Z047]